MTWLKLIATVTQLTLTLVSWLRERELLKAGEAIAIQTAYEIANERVQIALEARRRARTSDPDSDDPYLRD